jgi:hypothetical protein
MTYKKGDLFIGNQNDNKGTVIIAIEDTLGGGYKQTLCRFLNCPNEPEKVGTKAFFAEWVLLCVYSKVE